MPLRTSTIGCTTIVETVARDQALRARLRALAISAALSVVARRACGLERECPRPAARSLRSAHARGDVAREQQRLGALGLRRAWRSMWLSSRVSRPQVSSSAERGRAHRRVLGAEVLGANDRQQQRAEDDRAAEPVHAPAARHHAAGDGGEPQDAERGHVLVAEADDQHGGGPGGGLLESSATTGRSAANCTTAVSSIDREAGDPERRVWQQPRLGEDQRDPDQRPSRSAFWRRCGARAGCAVVALDRHRGLQHGQGHPRSASAGATART